MNYSKEKQSRFVVLVSRVLMLWRYFLHQGGMNLFLRATNDYSGSLQRVVLQLAALLKRRQLGFISEEWA
jgi:hypothetical protein